MFRIPIILQHMPSRAYKMEIDYGDESDYKWIRLEPGELETVTKPWEELRAHLKRVSTVSPRHDENLYRSLAALCIQDDGICLVNKSTGRQLVLGGRLKAEQRVGEAEGFKRIMEFYGLQYEAPRWGFNFEGGDVVFVDDFIFVGKGGVTDDCAIAWIRERAMPFGYKEVVPVEFDGSKARHLTTALTWAGQIPDGPHAVVMNPEWIDDPKLFTDRGIEVIEVPAEDDREKWAANVLPIGNSLCLQKNSPITRERLKAKGFRHIFELEWEEMVDRKVGFTCCCFIANHRKQTEPKKH